MRINDKENYQRIKDSITMSNLRKIIDARNFTVTKVAINSKVSDSTFNAYIAGQRTPSLPTIISIADYLNTNIDYLLDRTNNPIPINELENLESNSELSLLFNSIKSLPHDKQKLVEAYVKGLLNS